MKKLFLKTALMIAFSSASVNATAAIVQTDHPPVQSQCRYDHLPDEGVEYLDIKLVRPDGATRDWRRESPVDGSHFPFWVRQYREDLKFVATNDMEWRDARLMNDEFVTKNETYEGTEQPVRYYTAYTDNCQEIYLRIPTQVSPFSDQMQAEDDRDQGRLDFHILQKYTDMIVMDDWDKLNHSVGKKVTVIPDGESGVVLLSGDQLQHAYATPFQSFTLLGTSRDPLVINDVKLSNFHILVRDDEQRTWRMPWDPTKMTLGNPLDDVRAEFKDAVIAGKIKEGMNRKEVALVTGPPTWERHYPIFEAKRAGGRVIVDERYREDGFMRDRSSIPELEDKAIGEEIAWFFPKLGDKNTSLRFDSSGALDYSKQPAGAKSLISRDWQSIYKP